MTQTRGTVVSKDETGVCHCMSRRVRRAFLRGVDSYTGQGEGLFGSRGEFSGHRGEPEAFPRWKEWMEARNPVVFGCPTIRS